MGEYLDLHVIPPPEDTKVCERMAELLRAAHYSTVGVTLTTGLLNERVRSIRRIFEERGVSTVLRADFNPSSRTELLRILRRFRNAYDVIAVRCTNQKAATVACRDRRVDIVFFDIADRNLRFSHTFARLLHGAVEFNFVSDMVRNSWAFSKIRKAILIAKEHHSDVVLSSGAKDQWMVRSPLQVRALAITLGLGEVASMRGVSSVPLAIVTDNRLRRSSDYVEEGVKIVVHEGR